jgi:hypothetical protein
VGDAVVIRYKMRPDTAEENQALVEDVFTELAAKEPAGLQYATYRFPDGVTFMHVVVTSGAKNPLMETEAFNRFQEKFKDRVAEGPDRDEVAVVGSYNFGPAGQG